MTDTPLTVSTQIAPPSAPTVAAAAAVPPISAPVSASASSAHENHASSNGSGGPDLVDEEPYTIKCICDYSDDDGNTIYCETCDTWQHIECFYPGRVADASRAEFDHSCADCKPRPLDRRHATERQRSQRQDRSATDDKKSTKRPPSSKSSHRKRSSKPADLQVNGHAERDDSKHGSPNDHHPPAKKKGHRASQSINSSKRSPPFSRPSSHAHTHPPSPAKTPPDLPSHVQVHSYSPYFKATWDGDSSFEPSDTNSFASLPVTNSLSLWLHDSQKLREDAGVNDKEDVFQNLVVPVSALKWPELRVERRDFTLGDERLHYRYLMTPTHLNQAGRIGELNGVVGFQKDYCNDDMNRWQETAHPRPFVFFHPRLPLFIDTRQEGSNCRYVRRSCRANTVLETFIAGGSEYHFWLISERPLPANEQITIAWDFRFPAHIRARFLHLLNLGDEDAAAADVGDNITEEEYDHLAAMIDQVLSDHGGCACGLGQDCSFARFHRNYLGRSQAQANGAKPKKGRKPKQSHVSPTSTGHATNSRAASEGQAEPYDGDDGRSVSGSTRSRPHSRDLTPLSGIPESNGLSVDMSDREKRKIAMLEDTFKKLEEGQPARKKKRASDGAQGNSSTTPQTTPKVRQKATMPPRMSVSAASGANGSRPRYVDAATSGHQSLSPLNRGSPAAATPPPQRGSAHRSRQASAAPTPRSNYADSSTQTEAVEDEWYSPMITPPKRKKAFIPLPQRLIRNRQRAQQEVAKRASLGSQAGDISPVVPMDLDTLSHDERSNGGSPTDVKARNPSIASSSASLDPTMTDTFMADSPSMIKPPLPPWPHNVAAPAATSIHKSPGLRVQLPAPTFSTPNMSGTPTGTTTPSSAVAYAQSPFGSVFPPPILNGVAPQQSPAKMTKKLTLSDYRARKKNLDTSGAKPSGGTSPTVAPAVLKTSSEDAKLDGAAMAVDSPAVEKTGPVASARSAAEDSSPKNNPAALEQPNGSL
jgi:hypothetical protein